MSMFADLDRTCEDPESHYHSQGRCRNWHEPDVVYLGNSRQPTDHKTQLEIIQELPAAEWKKIAIMEMFQRPIKASSTATA